MKNLLTLIFLVCSLVLSAQEVITKDVVSNALANLYSQLLVYPQEKIYVQTDRPYYLNGEKIYFRTFLLNASKLTPAAYSRYVYVELISPVDTVVVRRQIRINEEKMFYGALPIPESLPEGEYRIRAYTRFMENLGEKAFYTRSVFIADPKSAKLDAETSCDYSQRGRVGVKLGFKDAKSGKAAYPKQLVIKMGKSGKEVSYEPGTNGEINATVDIAEKDATRTLLVDYKDGANSFRKYIQLPRATTQPEVHFYPEGGQLIAESTNRVAFKALLPDGKPAQITGSIYNSRNEVQVAFSTQHEGMGSFIFKPVTGESYRARYEYNGTSMEMSLPTLNSHAWALQAQWKEDSLEVTVRKGSEAPLEQCYLLVHRQGVPVYFQVWDGSKPYTKLSGDLFKTGVSHLMLLNKALQPLSERMVFNNRHDESLVEITTNAIAYHPRELVQLNISLTNAAEDTIASTFALAVTDDKDVKIDTTTNIVAEILLASELEGHIEHPAWYFEAGKDGESAADLLMLTHGWRNYYVTEALQANIQRPKTKPEITQGITGVLKKKSTRPYKNGKVQLTAIGCKFKETVLSDEEGRFEFSNFEFPDSTSYQLLSYTNEKTSDIEIYVDSVYYPTITIPWDYSKKQEGQFQEDNDFTAYVLKANRKYIQENGTRQIDLPTVTVKAASYRKEGAIDNHVNMSPHIKPRYTITPQEMWEHPYGDFAGLFRNLPPVTEVSESDVFIAGGGKATIVLNGWKIIKYSEINQVTSTTEIAQVDVVVGSGVPEWGDCLILLTTWPPGLTPKGAPTNFLNLLPLGYQLPVEFYAPKYDSPEALNNTNADLRSTIYWKPTLKTNKDAKTAVEFYTADNPSTYTVIVEGIGPKRKLMYCRKRGLITVEGKER